MKRFEINLFKGHPIITDSENVILVDTGSPATIHNSNSLKFCSEEFNSSIDYMGLTVNKVSEMLGKEITTLLGTDVMSNFIVYFDYKNNIVEFYKDAKPFEGIEVYLSNFMGVPIIDLEIENEILKFFLDTGAKLSYLSDSITNNYESNGTDEDFYPGVGLFETSTYEILTKIGEHGFRVKYGNLPTLLQSALMFGGAKGIIGFDFFDNFKVEIDFKNNKLKYSL